MLSCQRSFNGYLLASEVIAYCKIITLIDPLEVVVTSLLEIDLKYKTFIERRDAHNGENNPDKNKH